MSAFGRPIILDTDFGGDCDDAAAIAILLALSDLQRVDLRAVVASNPTRFAGPAISAITAYYGYEHIPIGTLKPVMSVVPVPPLPQARVDTSNVSGYAEAIAGEWPVSLADAETAPDPVALYRRILSDVRDRVTIAVIGGQTNLAGLLLSPADEYSSLTGAELVRDSVSELYAMGGRFPSGREWNFRLDPVAARLVADEWPTPVVYGGYEVGVGVRTGSGLFSDRDLDSPIRRAYELHPAVGWGGSRSSWDQIVVYTAAFGMDGLFELSPPGWVRVGDDGSNVWDESPDGDRRFLRASRSDEEIAAVLEALMVAQPVAR